MHVDWRKHGAAGVVGALARRKLKAGAQVVIYCEFGGKRSPAAAQAALKPLQACGAVGYVLHGGYARFLRAFPACCEPEGGYVPED